MTQNRIIRLVDPLPCSIYDPAQDGICGRPATLAYAYPHTPRIPDPPTPGLWVVQPVCERCAHAAASIYQDGEP